MGQFVITIHGTGPHHNYVTRQGDPEKGENPRGNYLIPDGQGGYVRTHISDADILARAMVEMLRKHGHTVTAATFTHGGEDRLV